MILYDVNIGYIIDSYYCKFTLKTPPLAIVKSSRGSTVTSGLSHVNAINETVDVVGHIPKNMAAPYVSKFLKRASNSASVTVKGKRINRGAGYGLEIPCVYTFRGDQFSLTWLRNKIRKTGHALFDEKL
jgi:hypothetical protein